MIEVESVKFKGVIFDPNNRTSRFIYSQEIVDRELTKYTEKVKYYTALGRFNPPILDDGIAYPAFLEIDPLNCAFVATNLTRYEDGSWVVEGKTLKTPYGGILNSLLVSDIKMKLTLTGTGTFDENNVVGDDFSLIAIDIMPEGSIPENTKSEDK